MGRILIKTVLLLGIALAAGYVHSQLAPVHTSLPTAVPTGVTGDTGPKSATGAPTVPTGEPPKPAPTGNHIADPIGTVAQPPQADNWFISVQQAKAIYDKNEAVFVDARTFDEYKEGHVPGSMHMDKKYFDGAAGPMKAKNLKGQAVVIYCHGAECTDSQAVAQRFISLNYQIGPIHIIKDGFPGWVAAGYPVDKGNEVGW
jgi:rhodanese-related sulfurtransferase